MSAYAASGLPLDRMMVGTGAAALATPALILPRGAVAQTVLEHLIAPGSVSALA